MRSNYTPPNSEHSVCPSEAAPAKQSIQLPAKASTQLPKKKAKTRRGIQDTVLHLTAPVGADSPEQVAKLREEIRVLRATISALHTQNAELREEILQNDPFVFLPDSVPYSVPMPERRRRRLQNAKHKRKKSEEVGSG